MKSVLILAAMIFLNTSATGTSYASDVKPNIIFILADDLGYGDLGCYGQKLIETPNIDRLAAEGMRFTQAYAGSTVCTASRCVLMTGKHNGHTVARDNIPHYATYLQEEDVTVAEVLNQSGYRCGGIGKWSLGDAGTVGRATNQGFDSWFGYLNQDHAHYYFTEYLDDDEGRLELSGNSQSRSQYSHDLMTERALRFIQESQDQPFFLYAAYTLPHFSSQDEDADGLAVPSTAPYSDRDWDDKSKKYAAMVHMLDRDVGRIMDLVDKQGIRDNTLIIVTSDNGGGATVPKRFRTNGELRGYKRDLTEGGIRVPFVARWPGVCPAGTTSEAMIGFQDMLPTFVELSDGDLPTEIDGISILEALHGRRMTESHDYLYWDYGHCRDRFDQAVRVGDWKGIRLGVDTPIQLFNLEGDIAETTDVAAMHPAVVKRVSQIMDSAVVPHDRYRVGTIYKGGPIWKRSARVGN